MYARHASSDRGHIHLSGRTDYQTSDAAAGYDPVARVRGAAMADLSYDPNRVPKLPAARTAKLMIAELWTWVHQGVGVYADKPADRGGLIARLDRIEDAVSKAAPAPASAAEIAAALVADPAFIEAVRFPSAAELVAEMIRQFGTPAQG
jgi:hypothetical protein